MQSHAKVVDNGLDDTTAALMRFESGATATFATLAYAPRYWRVALFGTDGVAELHGHERLAYTPRRAKAGCGITRRPTSNVLNLQRSRRPSPAARPIRCRWRRRSTASRSNEAMIGAAASGSTYRVA